MLSTDLNESPMDTEESNVKQPIESTDSCSNDIENASSENIGNEKECNETVIDKNELIIEATNLLNQGKQLLSIKDYASAASTLLSACCKFCEIYGDLSDECGDAYFYYGCALLELASVNNQSSWTHIKGNVTEEHINTSKAELNDQNSKEDNVNENVESDEILTNSSDNGKDQSGNESSTKEEILNKNEDSKEDSMNPVDISDDQLVQEILLLAKDTFIRQNNEEKLINTYSKLGKAYMFSGDYSKAIANSQECLVLQEKQTKPAEKELVDTLIQLGTACLLSSQHYAAVRHFTTAGVILEKYVRYLSRTLDSYDGEGEVNEDDIYNEIHEARNQLKSIKDKICDAEEQIRDAMKVSAESKNNSIINNGTKKGSGTMNSGNLSASSFEARSNVISNLLKRKRKLVVNNGNEMKKLRLEISS